MGAIEPLVRLLGTVGLVQFFGAIFLILCTIFDLFERCGLNLQSGIVIALVRFFFYFAGALGVIFLGTVPCEFNLLRFDGFNSLQQSAMTTGINLATVSAFPAAYLIQIECFVIGILHVTLETLIDCLISGGRCRFLALDLVNVFYLRFDGVFGFCHVSSTISKGG